MRLKPFKGQLLSWPGDQIVVIQSPSRYLREAAFPCRVEGAPINGRAVVAICLPSCWQFFMLSRNEAPVGRGLTFVPGNVKTRIRLITRRHSLLPTSQTCTPMGSPHDSLSLASEGGIRGFHVPFLKCAGLGACCRPGSLWVTRRHR